MPWMTHIFQLWNCNWRFFFSWMPECWIWSLFCEFYPQGLVCFQSRISVTSFLCSKINPDLASGQKKEIQLNLRSLPTRGAKKLKKKIWLLCCVVLFVDNDNDITRQLRFILHSSFGFWSNHLSVFLLLFHISCETETEILQVFNRWCKLQYVRYLFYWRTNLKFATKICAKVEIFPNELKIIIIQQRCKAKIWKEK